MAALRLHARRSSHSSRCSSRSPLAPVASAQERHERSADMSHVENLPYAARQRHAELRHRHRVRDARRRASTRSPARTERPADRRHHATRRARIVARLRLRRHPGRRPGLHAQRATRPAARSSTYTVGHARRRRTRRPCYREAAALGFDVRDAATGRGKQRHVHRRHHRPAHPRTVVLRRGRAGLAQPDRAPERRLPLQLELRPDHVASQPAIEVFDISDLGAAGAVGELALPTRPGPRHRVARHHVQRRRHARVLRGALARRRSSTRRDPAAPTIVTSFVDPAINVWHQADPFTIIDPAARERDFLVVEDEFAGRDRHGPVPQRRRARLRRHRRARGAPGQRRLLEHRRVGPTPTARPGRCTAHVLDIHEASRLMTIAFYNGGAAPRHGRAASSPQIEETAESATTGLPSCPSPASRWRSTGAESVGVREIASAGFSRYRAPRRAERAPMGTGFVYHAILASVRRHASRSQVDDAHRRP